MLTGPVITFAPMAADEPDPLEPLTWFSTFPPGVVIFSIVRLAAARQVLPDDRDGLVDRFLIANSGVPFGAAMTDELRGPSTAFTRDDVDLIVNIQSDHFHGHTMAVGYNSDELTAAVAEAGSSMVEQSAVYKLNEKKFELQSRWLAVDPANEVVVVSRDAGEARMVEWITRTQLSPSLADDPVLVSLLAAAGEFHTLYTLDWGFEPSRYPQPVNVAVAYTIRPTRTVDERLLITYSSETDAQLAADQFRNDLVVRRIGLSYLEGVEIDVVGTVMTIGMLDTADPQLQQFLSEGRSIPPLTS